jgi:hypothetical protein
VNGIAVFEDIQDAEGIDGENADAAVGFIIQAAATLVGTAAISSSPETTAPAITEASDSSVIL